MFLQLYTGIMVAVARFLVAVVVQLLTMPRMDKTALPAWIERYTNLDSGTLIAASLVLTSQ